jgi:excisionase family DNA binding protein
VSTQGQSSEWITQADAARIRGVTRQAISKLVKAGRLETLQFGGHLFVRRAEVEEFIPVRGGRVEETNPEYRFKTRAVMSEIEELLLLMNQMSEVQKREVLARLREELPIHPLEADWNVSAEVILEAISRATDLTQRGVRGVIAEAIYVIDILPNVKGWTPFEAVGDSAYDAIMKRDLDGVKVSIQVKMQRKKAQRPMMANSGAIASSSRSASHATIRRAAFSRVEYHCQPTTRQTNSRPTTPINPSRRIDETARGVPAKRPQEVVAPTKSYGSRCP